MNQTAKTVEDLGIYYVNLIVVKSSVNCIFN